MAWGETMQVHAPHDVTPRIPGRDFRIRGDKLPPTPSNVHGHPYFQLHIALGGSGDSWFGDCPRPLRSGSLCFANVRQNHLVRRSGDFRGYIIDFMPSFYWPDGVPSADIRSLVKTSELRPFLYQEWIDFRLSKFMRSDCEEIVRHIECEVDRDDTSPAIVRSYLTIFLSIVSRAYGDQLDEVSHRHIGSSRHRAVDKVLRLVEESYHRQLNLEDAAQVACLSSAYLSHLIVIETGKSFTDLLTEKRVQHSRYLLTRTNMRISEIARAVGYEDENYFSRRFRQVCGTSPREFRVAALR